MNWLEKTDGSMLLGHCMYMNTCVGPVGFD